MGFLAYTTTILIQYGLSASKTTTILIQYGLSASKTTTILIQYGLLASFGLLKYQLRPKLTVYFTNNVEF